VSTRERLPLEVAEVEEPIAVHVAVREDLNLRIARAVEGKDALHPDAVGDLANSEGRLVVALRLANDDAFEGLLALLLAFL